MPIKRYGYDLTCDVCGETGPAVEIAEPHEEEEPHNSVQVCELCLAAAMLVIERGGQDTMLMGDTTGDTK